MEGQERERRHRTGRRPAMVRIGVGAALALLLALAGGGRAAGADVGEQARTIIKAKACGGCHFVPGIPTAMGTIGPSLKGISERPRIAAGRLENTPENMREWLTNPKAILQSTMMPNLGLEPEEIEILVEYLGTL
jgi:cytochrome c2